MATPRWPSWTILRVASRQPRPANDRWSQAHICEAVEGAFGGDIDYAMLVKLYGAASESAKGRYSPAECIGARKERIEGNPDPKHVSTSYAERNNLNIRMHTRRMTRLTNAFSKKIENHAHAMALHFLYYNFVRIHKTLQDDARDGRWRHEAALGNERRCGHARDLGTR